MADKKSMRNDDKDKKDLPEGDPSYPDATQMPARDPNAPVDAHALIDESNELADDGRPASFRAQGESREADTSP